MKAFLFFLYTYYLQSQISNNKWENDIGTYMYVIGKYNLI